MSVPRFSCRPGFLLQFPRRPWRKYEIAIIEKGFRELPLLFFSHLPLVLFSSNANEEHSIQVIESLNHKIVFPIMDSRSCLQVDSCRLNRGVNPRVWIEKVFKVDGGAVRGSHRVEWAIGTVDTPVKYHDDCMNLASLGMSISVRLNTSCTEPAGGVS